MQQFGTLTIRLPINQPMCRVKWVTIHKFPCIPRDACEGELEIFFTDNPNIKRRDCAMQWVYTEELF